MDLAAADTIVGPATADGSGCRGILRVCGPLVPTLAGHAEPPAAWPAEPFCREARLPLPALGRAAPVRLLGWPAGRSATGQPMLEWHLPAGPALMAAAVQRMLELGARLAKPGEFTLRTFLAGRIDLAQAEGVLGLIEADGAEQLAFALDQRAGGLSKPVAALRNRLLDLLADVEAGLDFADEDISFATVPQCRDRLAAEQRELAALARRLADRAVASGRPRVLLLGAPNAGKSSLCNALAGAEAALVSPVAGTTRDYLVAPASIDGFAFELLDSAGIDAVAEADPRGIHGQAAAERTRLAAGADLMLWCRPPGDETPPPPGAATVRTKADLLPAAHGAGECRVSVVGPPGLSELQTLILRLARRPAAPRIAERAAEALARAAQALAAAEADLMAGQGFEIFALGLRDALDALGEIGGAVCTNDLLDRVFSRFCIGK